MTALLGGGVTHTLTYAHIIQNIRSGGKKNKKLGRSSHLLMYSATRDVNGSAKRWWEEFNSCCSPPTPPTPPPPDRISAGCGRALAGAR